MRKLRHGRNFRFLDNFNYYVPGVGGMFVLLLWLFVGSILGNLVMLIPMSLPSGEIFAAKYGMLISYPLMFIPPMIYAASKSGRAKYERSGMKLDSTNFGRRGPWICALMVIAATVALSFCMDLFNSMMPEMPAWLEETIKSLTTGDVWVNFICVSIFAPLFEEWLCRGIVLRGLLGNGMKPVWAIIVSALFFAVIHLNPWQALPAFALGALFGYVYYKTGSLKLTMLMHFTNNTLALVCGHIDALKDMDFWTDVFSGTQYGILFAAGIILLVLVVMEFARIPKVSPQGACESVPSVFDEN